MRFLPERSCQLFDSPRLRSGQVASAQAVNPSTPRAGSSVNSSTPLDFARGKSRARKLSTPRLRGRALLSTLRLPSTSLGASRERASCQPLDSAGGLFCQLFDSPRLRSGQVASAQAVNPSTPRAGSSVNCQLKLT